MNLQQVILKIKQFPVAVGLGAVALLLLVAVGMRYSRLPELEEQVVQLDDQLAKMRRNALNASKLNEDSAELTALLADIDARLANPTTKASNLTYFYGLRDRFNLKLTRVNQDEAEHSGVAAAPTNRQFDPLNFSISAEGSFANILRFLDAVQRERYLVRVDRVRLYQSQASTSQVVMAEISLSMLAPAQQQPAP